MRNLIFLFIKHGGFVTFFVIEVLCMYLVVNNNQRQGEIYLNSLSAATDYVYDKYDNLAKFITISSHADSLQREVTRFMEDAKEAKYEKSIFENDVDAPETTQYHSYIEAQIINSSTKNFNNSFTINRGADQGVKPSMGVIGASHLEVVGIVKSTSKHFSRVMSILHQQSRISASLKRNGHRGSIVWKGKSPMISNFTDVPKHADIIIGDTVETSGVSTIFPGRLMIGVVDTFWLPPGSNYYEIKVRLKNDLNRTRYVFVVENLMDEELQELQDDER